MKRQLVYYYTEQVTEPQAREAYTNRYTNEKKHQRGNEVTGFGKYNYMGKRMSRQTV